MGINMGSFLPHLTIPTSGMSAQRLRMEVIGHNVANASTTMTETGEAFRRQITLFQEVRGLKNVEMDIRKRKFGDVLNLTLAERREKTTNRGVQVQAVLKDYETPFTPVYDPTHPHADEDGYYYMPNVDVAEEQMDYMAAQQSFMLNYSVFNSLASLASRSLTLGRN
ncbi:MAG: flagellar basal body rod protein FlgC [Oscillospiraceae bacterium]|nr:flagellar basal body rod protein FlgC [Oscillospiraceae bacterium]